MHITFCCDSKYLIFPASHYAQNKRVCFYINGKLVYDLVIPLDYYEPDYQFPLNVERFHGKEIEISTEPEMELQIQKSDQIDGPMSTYSGKYRPISHFTAKRGWLNDPNGLVYYQGKYLMFYQHNPVACTWENMHWGYAVSRDLVHWDEQDIALYPDEAGTVFSGSAIIDEKNRTGWKENDNDVLLLFYTAAGGTSKVSEGKPFTQSLAYSVDGGKTFKKYEKNPLIGQVAPGNRDPKVVYDSRSDRYVMALYLDGNEFALYASENLLDWQPLQKLEIPGEIECPDFYPLPVDGNTAHVKWVFIGASDKYLIGDFDGSAFTPESGVKTLKYGGCSYAAQSWSNAPGGRRIRTACACATIPGMPFASCMSIPQEMSLQTIDGVIRLCAKPVPEIKLLYEDTQRRENLALAEGEVFRLCAARGAYDISLRVRFSDHADWSISLLGFTIAFSAEEDRLVCMDCSVPVSHEKHVIELRILLDTIYTEVFVNQGTAFLGMSYIQDSNLKDLVMTAHKGDMIVETLSVSRLKQFWTP